MEELRRLARYVTGFCLEEAPAEIAQAARYCVLDTIGAALGAARTEEIASIATEFDRWIGIGTPHAASMWAQGRKRNVFATTLVNGMLAHTLELDDVHPESKSHIGAVVVPTAWTLADALCLSGGAFLEAVVVGYETMGRIGMAMDVASNRKRGWHTTGIIGTFGAAAAAAHLLGLDEESTLSALGMAGTQSSGLWAFLAEGATCKKLHPARAAVNGLSAALLAKAGMTGPAHILDAVDGGLYAAVSDSFDMAKVCANLGTTFEILHIDKKPYPCCRSTHHAIDAALVLREDERLQLANVESIIVKTYDVAVLQCGSAEYPRNPVEAKFSIAYTCAAALVRGKVTLSEFDEACLGDTEIRRLAGLVKVEGDARFTSRYPKQWGCEMVITLKGGATLVKRVDDMSGSVRAPLTTKQEEDKFLSLARGAYNDENRADRILARILSIDSQKYLPDLA